MSAKVAVVLNANARGVNSIIVSVIKTVMRDSEKLYLSMSLEDVPKIAKSLIDEEFEAVLCGGGDGTFSMLVTEMKMQNPAQLPAFGVFRLGTGNALADQLGASDNTLNIFSDHFAKELSQARDKNARVPLSLIKVNDSWAPFVGVGLDALILEDYEFIKSLINKIPLVPKAGRGAIDYGLAIFMRSFWKVAFGSLPICEIYNGKERAYRLNFRGQVIEVKEPGESLYSGLSTIVAASTVQFYGFKLKVFPQANLSPNHFQLRVANMEMSELLYCLPAVLMGDLTHAKVWDWACEEIYINFNRPVQFQRGGDFISRKEELHFAIDNSFVAISGQMSAAPDPPIEK